MLKHRERERERESEVDANQFFLLKAILSFLGEQDRSNRWKVIKTLRKMSRAKICPTILHRIIRKIVLVKFLHCLTSGIKAGANRSSAKISIFSSVWYRSIFHLAQTILCSKFV